MRALEQSRHDEPWPSSWKDRTRTLLDAAGVKSESTFQKGSRNVRVDLQGESIGILPTTSKQYRNASAPLMDKKIGIPLTDARALGVAVVQALAISD
jgi:hypothetical protein